MTCWLFKQLAGGKNVGGMVCGCVWVCGRLKNLGPVVLQRVSNIA